MISYLFIGLFLGMNASAPQVPKTVTQDQLLFLFHQNSSRSRVKHHHWRHPGDLPYVTVPDVPPLWNYEMKPAPR